MQIKVVGYVFMATPRRRLGVQAIFQAGRQGRRVLADYGVEATRKASPRRPSPLGGRRWAEIRGKKCARVLEREAAAIGARGKGCGACGKGCGARVDLLPKAPAESQWSQSTERGLERGRRERKRGEGGGATSKSDAGARDFPARLCSRRGLPRPQTTPREHRRPRVRATPRPRGSSARPAQPRGRAPVLCSTARSAPVRLRPFDSAPRNWFIP